MGVEHPFMPFDHPHNKFFSPPKLTTFFTLVNTLGHDELVLSVIKIGYFGTEVEVRHCYPSCLSIQRLPSWAEAQGFLLLWDTLGQRTEAWNGLTRAWKPGVRTRLHDTLNVCLLYVRTSRSTIHHTRSATRASKCTRHIS